MSDQMDDQRIEDYLRTFRPLAPAPLPGRKRRWSFVALSAAAAVLICVLSLAARFGGFRPALAEPQTITMGSASDMLANTSSWKAVIDDAGFAFRTSRANAAPGRRSTLEFLSQEDLSK